MSSLDLHQKFAASKEDVFAVLSDHANMGSWLGMRVTVPVHTPGGGVGTVRRVHMGPWHLDEEIVEHEPSERMAYRIVAGLPGLRHHRGEVRLAGTDTGCELHWHVDVESGIPGLVALLLAPMRFSLGRSLRTLASRY